MLVTRPELIFGDEPTGNLDSTSSQEVLNTLRAAVDHFGQTVVIVTHDAHAASFADRVIFLADGKIAADLSRPSSNKAIMAILATIGWRSARSHPVRMLMCILAGIVASFFSVGTGAVLVTPALVRRLFNVCGGAIIGLLARTNLSRNPTRTASTPHRPVPGSHRLRCLRRRHLRTRLRPV